LRRTGLEDAGIATWITSNEARHMADLLIDNIGNMTKIQEIINSYMFGVYLNVLIWSSPDFKGNFKSRLEILNNIEKAVNEIKTE
jgi:hypothetical protein